MDIYAPAKEPEQQSRSVKTSGGEGFKTWFQIKGAGVGGTAKCQEWKQGLRNDRLEEEVRVGGYISWTLLPEDFLGFVYFLFWGLSLYLSFRPKAGFYS